MMGLFALPALAGKVLDFLKSPIGIVVIVGLAYLIGYWRGDSAADAKCEARARASIEAARQIDAKAQAEADARMREQIAAAQGREEAFRKQVDDYAKIAEQCTLRAGADDPVISVQPDAVPGRAPLPPRRGVGSPVPRR
jgi:hypothetical protein